MNSDENVIINNLDIFSDERGKICYSNSSSLKDFKRFYFIEHNATDIVRAWQGHPVEKKMFVPLKGEFLLAWVKIDNFNNPSLTLNVDNIKLSQQNNKCVFLPGGYANGLKATKKNSKILVFSEFYLKRSIEEKIRFPKNYWFDWDKY